MTGRPSRRQTLWKRPAPRTAQHAAHRALGNAQDAFPTRSHKGIMLSDWSGPRRRDLHRDAVVG
jgi:hypothetical protein